MTVAQNLLISVRLHDGRYHGTGEWAPSPARLFQALVAGAASGGLDVRAVKAFEWLEALAPPRLAFPRMRAGQRFRMFVPDNDLDAVDGDLERVAEIRSAKVIEPKLFDLPAPFLFAWSLPGSEAEEHARVVASLAQRLYQFGRGIDMAWADGQILSDDDLHARFDAHPGVLYRPCTGASPGNFLCPRRGSLASLEARHVAYSRRFMVEGSGKAARQLFVNSPKPIFEEVAYECPPSRRVYELRQVEGEEGRFAVWPLERASVLVHALRDGAAGRLRAALPRQGADIERCLIGRKANGADDAPTSLRVKIVPLPSIGHGHADHGIRRVLVEVPGESLVDVEDVHWAFSGLPLSDADTGEVSDVILVPAAHGRMLAHYGLDNEIGSRLWRTVTPLALPEAARRRRIDPARRASEAKGAPERAAEDARAGRAIAQALRHAEVRARVLDLRVQREPFEANGDRAERFAEGTRFSKERLWHVQIRFDEPLFGPLVIGDGRFLGLGVMRPVSVAPDIFIFAVRDGLTSSAHRDEVVRALRRAVMARVQSVLGFREKLPTFFSGHDGAGGPARDGSHLGFVFDELRRRLFVIAPHVLDRRAATPRERAQLRSLETAVADLREVRAGRSGRLHLQRIDVERISDPLFRPSTTWKSMTPYVVNRHVTRATAIEALAADVRAECTRVGLPRPEITVTELAGRSGIGLSGTVELAFSTAIPGMIALGRTRYFGGGLFATGARA